MGLSVILSFANKASGPFRVNKRLKNDAGLQPQDPDGLAKRSLRMTLTLFSLLITSIASIFSCKVGLAIYSTMLTIIMPISCIMLYLEGEIKNSEIRNAFNIFLKLAAIGFVFIIASAFTTKEDDVIINNYIPIINNLSFIGGLSIFLGSSFLACLLAGSNVLRLLFAIAAASLIISYRKIFYEISYPIDLHGYFEMLFLGPASTISIISLFLVYLIFQKILNAETSMFGEYPSGAASIIIFKHHFLSEVDSAKFFSLSILQIHVLKALVVFFIIIALIRYLKLCRKLVVLSLTLLLGFCLWDYYMADQGHGVEYFMLTYNYGITTSIMCFINFIFDRNKSYLMKYNKILIIIYALSSILIMFDSYNYLGKLFTAILGILFALICITNIIFESKRLGTK